MEKTNFNLDAHSSLIIADGSIVEINGQKVLLTIVKDAHALDVTDTPPLSSLKYEDCFESLHLFQKQAVDYALYGVQSLQATNPRQAKQLAATIKLMTIAYDANGDWIIKHGEQRYLASYDESTKRVVFIMHRTTLNSPIYFRDYETAQRAYEANKEIFHEYFGINE